MKKLFLFILIFSALFFGCKSTENIQQNNSSENQLVPEVLPNENLLEEANVDLSNEQDNGMGESELIDKGDLPLPFYDEFVPLVDEIETTDEFFYGEDFFPEEDVLTNDTNDENHIDQILESESNFIEDLESESKNILTDELDFTEIASANENKNDYTVVNLDEKEITNESEKNPTIENEKSIDKELETNLEDDIKKDIALSDSSNNIEDTNNIEKLVNNDNINKIDNPNNPQHNIATNKDDATQSYYVDSKNDKLIKTTETDNNSFSSTSDFIDDSLTVNDKEIELDDNLEKGIIPSRSVTVAKNQLLVVPYPGTGWVYLGEIESHALVGFRGKTFSANNTTFKLQPQKEGKTILHFYKIDAISGNYIDDYLEVIVTPTVEDYSLTNTITAPDYNYDSYLLGDISDKLVQQDVNEDDINQQGFEDNIISQNNNEINDSKMDDFSNNQSNEKKLSNVNKELQIEQNNVPIKEVADVEVVEEEPELVFLSDMVNDFSIEEEISKPVFEDDLFTQAIQNYDNKEYSKALSLINEFLQISQDRIDEALFLKGQILEKPFEYRNIRDALDCYKTVISTYPQSDLWDSCDERIKYIQRFYFNIR